MKQFLILLFTFITMAFAQTIFTKPEEIPTWGPRSLDWYSSQLESRQNDVEFLYNYAWQARQENKHSLSVEIIEKAISLRPQNSFLRYKAGLMYLSIGDRTKAKENFEKALDYHYEYEDVWEQLLMIAPEYYFQFANLYNEKAHQFQKTELADKAIEYYRTYITKVPDGEYLERANAGIRDMELLKEQIRAQQQRIAEERNRQASISERRAAEQREKELFRTTRTWFVGLYFNSFSPSENYVFKLKDSKRTSCYTKMIYLKRLPEDYIPTDSTDTVQLLGVVSLSEFLLSGGKFFGPVLIRASLALGHTGVKKLYVADPYYDSLSNRIPEKDMKFPISSINTTRFHIEGIYNFYFRNPVLLYVLAGADLGSIYISDRCDYFESKSIAGIGVGGGIMIRFGNLLFDLSYKQDVLGSASGGILSFGGMFKF